MKKLVLIACLLPNIAFANEIPLCIQAVQNQKIKASLENKKTANGVDFDKIMASGIKTKKSKIGCYAGDAESYQTFAPIFDYVLDKYHHKTQNKTTENYDVSAINQNFSDDAKKLISSTRIRFARNIEKFPFPSSMSKQQRYEVEKTITDAINSSDFLKTGTYTSLEKMSKKEQEKLRKEHLLFNDITEDEHLNAAGISGDYPHARGIYISKDKKLVIWINEEDHMRVISIQENYDIRSVFENLVHLENELRKTIKFAYSKKYGYLASCPTNIGTGMRASVLLKLENLGKNQKLLKEIAKSFNIDVRGVFGENSNSEGGIFDISNSERFGKSPEELINNMIRGVNLLVEIDKLQAQQK
ncbi:ATP--guanido phosphotransferase [Candidatus Deianiraea vastatrix]|uniref:Arginine kinase n=1 Tax=Candidatus Deianiraea vastatrix TaxID=2163644 RepID=A0A5B8XHX4_9RICK|nr:hypothetical protein [Candidatus Deianiraea vastatrix]QED23651.1 Putative arginine kinase [Candidatus Deianiraea vastatrix]